jgi:hypothetical protein
MSIIGIIYGLKNKDEVIGGSAFVSALITAGAILYVYKDDASIKTCDPTMWKRFRDNVSLPAYILSAGPDYTETSLCDAQKYIQYERKGTGFFYDGSNVYVVDDYDIQVTRSPTSSYTFYYLIDKDIKPKIVSPTPPTTTTPAAATTTTTTTVPAQNDASCCFRNNNNECITFENTSIGSRSTRSIDDFFVNRAGKNYGSEIYISDFTSRDLNGNTKLLYKQSQLLTTPPPNVNDTENIPSSDFSWPVCVPQTIKNMSVKRIKNLSTEYQKSVKVDAWLMRAEIEHMIYIIKNGSSSNYFVVPNTPWKYPLQIRGDGLFNRGTSVKYNDEEFITTESIVTTLRNKLITE